MNDTAEQLEAAQAQSVRDEATIAELHTRYAAALDVAHDQARQIAELEHDLARAESALADRLQHDAHTHPTAHTLDRAALYAVLWPMHEDIPEGEPERKLLNAIIGLVQPADGVLITAEEAALAVRAARHSAESIRAVLDVDPARLHPDVAPYVDRLTDLADRLTRQGDA